MISIITSLYKSDRYLDEFSKQLKFFSQELTDKNFSFEIIIVANEPTEREKLLEKQFSGQPWFSFVSVPREPVFASWNRGVSLARGQILGFWNVDDLRYSAALAEAQDLFDKGAQLVYFPFYIKRYFKIGTWYLPLPRQKIDRQIPEFSPSTLPEFRKSMFCGPFFMFTRSLYEAVGPFDEQFKVSGDLDWCVRAAYKSDKFVKAKSMAGVFRVDGGGLSAGVNPLRTAENNIVYIRSHAWDKMTIAEDVIIKQYRPKYLLHAGKFSELSPLKQA